MDTGSSVPDMTGAVSHVASHALADGNVEVIDCPVPDLVSLQSDILDDLSLLKVWFAWIVPLALVALCAAYVYVPPPRFHRPSGPTRQAVLQRFTL